MKFLHTYIKVYLEFLGVKSGLAIATKPQTSHPPPQETPMACLSIAQQLARHQDRRVHHGLDSAPGGLLGLQRFLEDHVLANDSEPIVRRHPHEQKRLAHLEFARG